MDTSTERERARGTVERFDQDMDKLSSSEADIMRVGFLDE